MKRQVVALSLLVATLVACGAEDEGEEPATPPPTDTASPSPEATETTTPEGGAQPPLESGDWRLDSITVEDDGLGSFGGRARITYLGDAPDGGTNTFTITVFKDGSDIASLAGSVSDVPPGETATANLISTDDFVGGPYTYDFQKDF
ncbi:MULTISPECIES: hypothetical protein [unclassified Streptomyces]|uniref:hypothetical protein n=1 Tax=unclassified Streptomyces TaxID=2593676 RepID=UPI0022B7405F|nr:MULTISPECIES: hypothetical protein [unclassified Streptomyces]MCZ7417324.1 hypothetical protein [Streptomyces sp. WMMC897]MCZ7432849.1 hypothetical protein [Streptomyces sp. WMMC1477]